MDYAVGVIPIFPSLSTRRYARHNTRSGEGFLHISLLISEYSHMCQSKDLQKLVKKATDDLVMIQKTIEDWGMEEGEYEELINEIKE